MTREKYNELQQIAIKGDASMPDELNPALMLSTMPTKLLSMIAKGELDVKTLALYELENRYLDINGNWVKPKK